MVVLFLFEVGFTMLVMAINQPYKPSMDLTNDEEITEKLLVQELELCKLFNSCNIKYDNHNLILIYMQKFDTVQIRCDSLNC